MEVSKTRSSEICLGSNGSGKAISRLGPAFQCKSNSFCQHTSITHARQKILDWGRVGHVQHDKGW